MKLALSALCTALLSHVAYASPVAQDYGFAGEGQGLAGRTSALGPLTARLAWRMPQVSGATYPPLVNDGRIFEIRDGVAGGDGFILARDLATGVELWRARLPVASSQDVGVHAISGVRDGVVYATRSGSSFPPTFAPRSSVYALDAATGVELWRSSDTILTVPQAAGGFSPQGHPIVGGFSDVLCLDRFTGDLIWRTEGSGSNGAQQGVTVVDNTVTAFRNFGAGSSLVRYDATSGAQTSGFTVGNFFEFFAVAVGESGEVYVPRRYDSCAFSSITPDGELFVRDPDGSGSSTLRWVAPIRCSPKTQVAIDHRSRVYTISPSRRVTRRDGATGAILDETAPMLGVSDLRFATLTVDGAGYLYVYDMAVREGPQRLRVFAPDLQPVPFSLPTLPSGAAAAAAGGLAIAGDGVLVITDRLGTSAYRAPSLGVLSCSPAVSNSTGAPGTLDVRGSDVRADGDLVLRADDLPPGTFVLFLNADAVAITPGAGGSLGTLCLGGSVGRFNAELRTAGPGGEAELRVDLGAQPQPSAFVSVVAGETWVYQAWYRDVVAGAAVSNFTEAVSVAFL